MGRSSTPQPKSADLIQFCRKVFVPSPRYKTFFSFADNKVRLVLDDFGTSDEYPLGEVHVVKFEVVPKARGTGLASIAMAALCYGADHHSVHISLTPTSYDNDDGLSQRQLEKFYRRYDFRAPKGCGGRSITSMVRKPTGLKK